VCEKHAFSLRDGTTLDRNLCDRCGNCARVCPTNALKQVGRYYTEDELFFLLIEDKIYYSESGGGVTFSGGEPLIYPDYVGGLAKKLATSGISVAVETCGYFDWEQVSELVMPYVTEVLFDIKLFDNTQHRKYTGADNGIILENLRRLATFPKIHITPRTPLIPGITDTPENLRAIQGFLRELNLENRYQTLAFHDGGAKKREKLDMPKWVLPTIETIYNTLA
jgi:pyruvate formate lyase activating enzyme